MEVIFARNVNDAYQKGLALLRENGELQPSRAGEVLVSPVPVTTVYSHPLERVLFDPNRDANPFFHLFEALWMLSGSNDARWLDQFVKDYSSRFAEPGGLQHGAYGHRWRHHFRFNQLNGIIKLLRKDPLDRRIVLTMWDPWADLGADKRDVPCNTQAYFRVRVGSELEDDALDMTVCCRSNDAIWGCYGANAVHFSFLLEYVAANLGVQVGRYYQISNNFHAYTKELEKVGEPGFDMCYVDDVVFATPVITRLGEFDNDLQRFMEWSMSGWEVGDPPWEYANAWFGNTAEPLFVAAKLWRARERVHALEIVQDLTFDISPDWRLAAQLWIERRMVKASGGVA